MDFDPFDQLSQSLLAQELKGWYPPEEIDDTTENDVVHAHHLTRSTCLNDTHYNALVSC